LTFGYLNEYVSLISTIANKHLAAVPLDQLHPLVDSILSINGDVTLSIFFGRTIDDDRVGEKPIAVALRGVTEELFSIFKNPWVLLSGGRFIPAAYRRKV
jgi:hypothetical protein